MVYAADVPGTDTIGNRGQETTRRETEGETKSGNHGVIGDYGDSYQML